MYLQRFISLLCFFCELCLELHHLPCAFTSSSSISVVHTAFVGKSSSKPRSKCERLHNALWQSVSARVFFQKQNKTHSIQLLWFLLLGQLTYELRCYIS